MQQQQQQQQQQQEQLVDDLGFCPSFNCYSSASTSAARISTQLLNKAEEEDEFEFSLINEHEHEHSSTGFPLFNYNSLVQNNNNKVDEVQEHEQEETTETSDTSSDNESHVFCVWRHNNNNKTDVGALSKCKKSSSTGSGSKRWRIRDLLRRSNSEGKGQPMVSTVAGKVKPVSPAVHELWYAKQNGKRDGGKRRSYLPYRQGLVGFFNNVNGSGKKWSF